jgi:hypothetical protein
MDKQVIHGLDVFREQSHCRVLFGVLLNATASAAGLAGATCIVLPMAGQPRSTGYVPGKTAAETRSDERRNGRLLAFEKPRCLPISLTGGTKGDRRGRLLAILT